jgi:hypothetical protein
MKLMATSDFRNTHKLKIPGALHPLHVHKGAIFEVDETDEKTSTYIRALNAAGRIIDPDKQPEAVEKILEEIEQEKIYAANLEKSARQLYGLKD